MKRITILALSILLISGCGAQRTQSSDSSQIESETTETTTSSKKKEKLSLSDDKYDFTFKLMEEVYALPMDTQDLVKNGWMLYLDEYSAGDYDENEKIKPSHSTLIEMIHPDSKNIISVNIINRSNDVVTILNTTATDISVSTLFEKFTPSENSNIQLANEISLGSTLEEVKAAYGTPTSIDGDENSNYLRIGYKYTIENSYELSFAEEGGKQIVNGIDISTSGKFNASDRVDKVTNKEKLAKENKDYEYPSDLGDSLDAGRFKLNDTIYQIPVPVTVIMEQGWGPIENEEVYADYGLPDVFINDNQSVTFDLVSPTDGYSALEKAQAVAFSINNNNFSRSFELPKKITQNSTIDEIKAAYGEPDEIKEENNLTTLKYNGKYSLEIVFYEFLDEMKLSRMRYGELKY